MYVLITMYSTNSPDYGKQLDQTDPVNSFLENQYKYHQTIGNSVRTLELRLMKWTI